MRRKSERSTRHRQRHRRPCQLAAEFPLPAAEGGGEWGSDPHHRTSPSTLPTPHLSPPLGALCKSLHMLPRVPVSQRHSRASFCTRRNVVTDCRKGTIKRSRSLSLFPSHARYEPTYTDLAIAHRYAGRGGRCVRTRAREEFFSVPRSVPDTRHNLSRATPPCEGRRAVNRGNATGRERKREKEKGASPPPFPFLRVSRRFSFFTFIYTYRAIFCGILSSEVLIRYPAPDSSVISYPPFYLRARVFE